MDQDTTKNKSDSADRGNWRQRLGAGKELPKISQEFEPAEAGHADQQPQAMDADGNRSEPRLGTASPKSPPQGAGQPRPRTPVARPAPMAPRAPRPAAPSGETDGTPESPTSKTAEPRRPSFISLSSKPSSAPEQPPPDPGDTANPKSASRPSWPASSRVESGSSAAPQASFPRVSPSSPSSTRAPALGNDAFSERLRAQREAAERLAQQRLAAARQRSGQAKTAAEQRPAGPAAAHPTAKPPSHAAGAEAPRFTFAEEEIAAAQRETAPQEAPAAGGERGQPHVPPPYTPPHERAAAAQPHDSADPPIAAPESDAAADRGGSDPESAEPAEAYQVRPRDYDDESMFEAQPAHVPVPQRASAADYTAAYREFEDEFEDDRPARRGGGPLILLLSLLAVAVMGGGLIYWYQQSQGTVESQAGDIPVITAPSEPVKATPEPEEQPQQAAAPTRRKQIYDRILGEETLEPERIVPTEEQPQFRQIQQPQGEQGTPALNPDQGVGSGEQNDSTDPRPLPLPPPPGTGQQGDLLLPEPSEPVTAAATPVRGPIMAARSDRDRGDALIAPVDQSSRAAAAEPDRLDPPIAARAAAPSSALQRNARDDAGEPAPDAAEAVATPDDAPPEAATSTALAASTGGEPTVQTAGDSAAAAVETEPVSGPAAEAVSDAGEPEVPEEAAPAAQEAKEPAPAQEVEMAAVSDVSEEEASEAQAFAPPLPRTKPEPPVRAARASEPQPQPQPQAPRRSSGPVQITPTVLAPESSSRASVLPRTQAPASQPARPRSMGRESDPLEGTRSPISGSRAPSTQQLASEPSQPAPSTAPQQQEQEVASVEPQEAAPSQADSGSDYLVQLAAFRSEAEAESEYKRLAQSHPQLVGNLSSRIQEASLGQGGSFYRLGIGPLDDRRAATKLCNALIAAGEKDCLVRRR